MTAYYRFLRADGTSPYQGFAWPLPTDNSPLEWVDCEGAVQLCHNGLHGCRASDVTHWIDARMFEMEFDGEVFEADNKVAGARARLVRELPGWNEQTQRLFAADCAESVAHLWTAPAGVDWTPADTIRVVRRYASGLCGEDELGGAREAARDAAWAAAGDAWAAARDAARGAARDAAWAAAGAARGAARDAARGAARGAARAAADAAGATQSARLLGYAYGRVDLEAIRRGVE